MQQHSVIFYAFHSIVDGILNIKTIRKDDVKMDVTLAEKIAQSPAVWAICCIALTGFLLKKMFEKNEQREVKLMQYHEEYRTESKEREKELMLHLERSNESQERTAKALECMNASLSTLERRVDSIEKHAYKNKKECV